MTLPMPGDGATAARNRLLPEGRVAGPMPWVIAIMMCLMVLAGAASLALSSATRTMSADLAGGATIQIVDADAERRTQAVMALTRALGGAQGISSVRPVPEDALMAQLRPWLGPDAEADMLPVPALIDVELAPGRGDAGIARLRQIVTRIVPQARVEAHADFLAPVAGLTGTLGWIGLALMLLMATATAAVVILAARSAHDAHRGTIDILHLMGATDIQIARLFQRRIALDALFGSTLGFVVALLAILLVGRRLAATGSELLQAAMLSPLAWGALVALPIAGVALATLTARMTVLRALGRRL
ncbi:cell division protein FtsX [Sphingobium arseniciresistens]|uniref:cell division protein FtsX n=1 Tax=Sphingobium arseniciresistens TaxID=3030834 RepID=UPI003BB0FFA4